MNKKVFLGLLAIIMTLSVATAGCTSIPGPLNERSNQSKTRYSTYTNATAGVRIQYPSGWNIAEGERGSIATFSDPGSFVRIKLSSGIVMSNQTTLDEFKNSAVSLLVNGGNGSGVSYTLQSTEKTTLAGMPAYRLTFNSTTNGVSVNQMWIVTIKDNRPYWLIYTVAGPGAFSDYQKDFENMANSFSVTH